MRQPTQTILAYWTSIAGEGVPAKSAIDPRALKTLLPDLFILERMDRGLFAFRLAGTRLCARYGRELRDHDFVRLWPADQQGDIVAQLNGCLRAAVPVNLTGEAFSLERETTPFEIVLMPLRDAHGHVRALLGAMIFADGRRLAADDIVTAQRLVDSRRASSDAPQIEDVSKGFSAGRRTHVPHLRVLNGGKDDRFCDQRAGSGAHHSLAG